MSSFRLISNGVRERSGNLLTYSSLRKKNTGIYRLHRWQTFSWESRWERSDKVYSCLRLCLAEAFLAFFDLLGLFRFASSSSVKDCWISCCAWLSLTGSCYYLTSFGGVTVSKGFTKSFEKNVLVWIKAPVLNLRWFLTLPSGRT